MAALTRLLFPTAVAAALAGCAVRMPASAINLAPPEPADPVAVHRPIDAALQCFGTELRAYTTVDERDVVFEIDWIVNDTGLEKELPTDANAYVLRAIDTIGKPLVAFTQSSVGVLKTPAGSTLPLVPSDHPKPPPPSFVIKGRLLRFGDRAESVDTVTAGLLAGKGHGSTQADIRRERRNTVTSLTLSYQLATPDGVQVRGTASTVRIPVERTEGSGSKSLYVAGNGAGRDTRLTLTQDFSDALYDATAASLMQVLGRGLLVPYTRCSTLFPADPTLDARVHEAFSRLTQAQLEQHVKRFFYLAGFAMDLSSPTLTVADRAVIAVEMQHRRLDNERQGWVTLAEDLWHTLDFEAGAQRITTRLIETSRLHAEAAAQAERVAQAERIAQAERTAQAERAAQAERTAQAQRKARRSRRRERSGGHRRNA